MSAFRITREDGRSNAEVIMGVLETVQPGDLVAYDTLMAALSAGTDRAWTRQGVQTAVRAALPRIRRDLSRTVAPVVGVGYRVAKANEHSALAIRSERKAQKQVKSALETLKHVKWDEMTAPERTLHEAHLTLTGALWTQVSAVTKRQQKQDDAIAALMSRVDTLEQRA